MQLSIVIQEFKNESAVERLALKIKVFAFIFQEFDMVVMFDLKDDLVNYVSVTGLKSKIFSFGFEDYCYSSTNIDTFTSLHQVLGERDVCFESLLK